MQNDVKRFVMILDNVIRLDSRRAKLDHGPAMTRQRLSISWDPVVAGCDVRELLEELRMTRGSQYYGRKWADIGGMLLAEHALAELQRLKGKDAGAAS